MKIIKKILMIIFWIILGIVALYSTSIIFQKLILKNKIPSFLGYKNFIVLTGSMEPTLHVGDIVIVKKTTDIKENDIISFRIENTVVTHRVKEIYKENGQDYFITKGDANSGIDTELLDKKNIEGKYCFRIPFLGKIVLFLKKPIGIIVLFIILGLLLILEKSSKN